jgi:pimeloyl-ACP methyl ester carboxylesterase
MLPAMSTVSTRDELRALARYLETRRWIITDWPGFGDTARPRLDYDRALCRALFSKELVAHLQGELGGRSFAVVACGHAAGYAIGFEARQPGTFTHLVLIAPTWRAPVTGPSLAAAYRLQARPDGGTGPLDRNRHLACRK